MLKSLFTSSSKVIPYAFFLAVLFVCITEYAAYKKYDAEFFSHEVDRVLYRLKENKFDADFILIGDSVGLQLARQYSRDPEFTVLATNQATEMTGQYFLIKRYIEKNPAPKAVIFASRPFLDYNLEQVYTENFVLRTFTRFSEILSVFLAKHDFSMIAKMTVYKILFSYKHRLRIQKKIIGFTNADIYLGVDIESQGIDYSRYSFLQILDKMKKTENVALYHFKDLVSFLNKKNVDFYYIPIPIEEQKEGSSLIRNYNELFFDYFPSIKKKYPHFHYLDEITEYPKKLFVDHVHFNEAGLTLANPYMSRVVDSVINNYSY